MGMQVIPNLQVVFVPFVHYYGIICFYPFAQDFWFFDKELQGKHYLVEEGRCNIQGLAFEEFIPDKGQTLNFDLDFIQNLDS